MTTYFRYYTCPIGKLRLRASETGLLAVDHVNQQNVTEVDWVQVGDQEGHDLLDLAIAELGEYFNKTRKNFETSLEPQGTEFQQTVWAELQKIPFGESCSYSDIAEAIGNPKSVRAVGLANGKNPLSIFIPCHRVIGKSGKLTGYAGGLEAKRILLDLERSGELF